MSDTETKPVDGNNYWQKLQRDAQIGAESYMAQHYYPFRPHKPEPEQGSE